jgi:hypothetical protein
MRRLLLAFVLSVTACASFRDDPASLLDRGRYGEALDELRADEREADRYSPDRRARYALYRGLTHLALGDAPETDRWLTEAKSRFDADPRCLSASDAGRLIDAWQSLGRGR